MGRFKKFAAIISLISAITFQAQKALAAEAAQEESRALVALSEQVQDSLDEGNPDLGKVREFVRVTAGLTKRGLINYQIPPKLYLGIQHLRTYYILYEAHSKEKPTIEPEFWREITLMIQNLIQAEQETNIRLEKEHDELRTLIKKI